MAQFSDIFDVSNLDDYKLGHLQFVLNSPSYSDVFKPYLVAIRNGLNTKLLDPSKGRQEGYPDDFIRGGIVTIDGLLALFERLIEETSIEMLARSQQELTGEQQYERLREEGRIRPMTGVATPEEDFLAPEEDF